MRYEDVRGVGEYGWWGCGVVWGVGCLLWWGGVRGGGGGDGSIPERFYLFVLTPRGGF